LFLFSDTPRLMSRILFYPHLRGVLKRLPEHYKRRYLEAHGTQPVNYLESSPALVGRTIRMKNLAPGEYYDIPPKVMYPPESDRCLWAGEGIVVGNAQKNPMISLGFFVLINHNPAFSYPRSWRPKLLQHLFYSEILDRWMIIIVTDRALQLIEHFGGLDSYILSSSEAELHSRLAMHLKRDMLLRLVSDDFYATDRQKRETLLEKYSKFILPDYPFLCFASLTPPRPVLLFSFTLIFPVMQLQVCSGKWTYFDRILTDFVTLSNRGREIPMRRHVQIGIQIRLGALTVCATGGLVRW
uniref:Large ribosomal subunit protein bL28m n=1 Tax=Echinostoma caproni TaxID=27848 RepID=A0A183AM83_9TREM